MTRWVRELRLIPVVLLATASLAALKVLGLALDGGYLLTDIDRAAMDPPIHVERNAATGAATVADNKLSLAQSGPSWEPQALGYPDVTGSVAAEKQAEKNVERATGDTPAKPPPKQPDGRVVQLDAKPAASPAERAILERLQERRQELDSRGREIELRENLLKAAEKKFDDHANELRELESSAGSALKRKEDAEAQRLKNLVTTYENMKAKDAARIFDRLELRILVDMASQINPRRMSDILGQMSSEAAERLTVELANRANGKGESGTDIGNLPKIEGTPRN
jgi:flagellar motility protein MotE (MotC chaperone)